MLTLTIKDIRDILEKALRKHYDFVDFAIEATKVMDRSKEFRIEFRIYDAHFWMDIDPEIDSIHIGTRSFSADHLDTIQMWLSKPFDYDKTKFEFGWRSDLERFFDAFHSYLKEKVESKKVDEIAEGIIGESVIGEEKPSIFNNLKDDKDEDEYI